MKRVLFLSIAVFCTTFMFAKNVSVTINPANATLILKGKVIQPVTEGVYNIQVGLFDQVFTAQADGYDAEQFVISLKSPLSMQVNLKPNLKNVSVTADPREAIIYVDGREQGRGQVDFNINKGETKTLKVVADGYETFIKRINFYDQADKQMSYNIQLDQNRREVNVIVDAPAVEFYADGVLMASGKNGATITLYKNKKVQLLVRAEGFLEYNRLIGFYDEIPHNLTPELAVDEAYAQSEANAQIANKSQQFMVNKKYTREQAIQRLKYHMSELFESLEVNDNVSGWYRTAWNEEKLGDKVIRTRLEIKEIPDNGDGQFKYKFLLQTQYTYKIGSHNDQDFKPWGRVLKKYIKLVSDIQNLVN